jgi:hypothetical protein
VGELMPDDGPGVIGTVEPDRTTAVALTIAVP